MFELFLAVVVIAFGGRILDRAVHSLDLPAGPGMVDMRSAGGSFVMEGATLRPQYFADWKVDRDAAALCLYAEPIACQSH